MMRTTISLKRRVPFTERSNTILPLFYNRPMDFAKVMRSAIAVNASFLNAQRMVAQYVQNAYAAASETERESAIR